MLYMLMIDGNQYGCYSTKANAVAALTHLRAEDVDGEAQIKQVDYDHDSELAEKMRGLPLA